MLDSAVIGVGHVGKYHVEKYMALPDFNLAAVVDTNLDLAKRVASKFGCVALTDYRELIGKVNAVSIAVPTNLHFEIARNFLDTGSHVLIEKPITETVEQANKLIELANANNQILQVGHIERFNVAMFGLDFSTLKPRFIESYRISPFTQRSNDVNVILDLMIHDIDIILDIVDSDIISIDANGSSVVTDMLDIANARITFQNGCVANITASRVSFKRERKIRLFTPNSYISLDLQNNVMKKYSIAEGKNNFDIKDIHCEEIKHENGDALLDEIKDFQQCIQLGNEPIVSGKSGQRALETAIRITELINK
jgi:predicted dehydrogenase